MNEPQQNPWLRVLPLGGLGHIGGNLMVFETVDDLLLVDCGVLFPTVEEPGIDYVVPDIRYVVERRHKLRGIVLTHGHEDHIGALPYLLPMLGETNLWGTRFTVALIGHKMREHPDLKARVTTIQERAPFAAGRIEICAYAVTHSIPHAVGLSLKTPVGTVVHTGDFKLDPTPIDGRVTDEASFRALGEAGVVLLCSDSTNSLKPGRTFSEKDVHAAVGEVIGKAKERVFFTTFASHIDRIQAVCDAAVAAGRHVLPVGRSMLNNIGITRELGLLRAPSDLFVSPQAFDDVPRNKIVVLASGSQGEPFSSMSRIANANFAPIVVEKGDLVVFSSRRIPGNERAISGLTNAFVRQGATIVGDHEARVHSSGHAFADEQADMIDWCRPAGFLPVHGELRHLVVHAELARSRGVPAGNAFVLEDGWPLLLTKTDQGVHYAREAKVRAGFLFIDGKGVGDIGDVVLRDRRYLSEAGVVACIMVVDYHGKLVLTPHIVTRGTVHNDANEALLDQVANGVEREIRAEQPIEMDDFRQIAKRSIRRFFKQALGRKPVIVPVVLKLPDHCCD